MKTGRGTKRIAAVCAILCIPALSAMLCGAPGTAHAKDGAAVSGTGQPAALSLRIANHDAIVEQIRDGLTRRASAITVTFLDTQIPDAPAGEGTGQPVLAQCETLVKDWMEEALAETDDPAQGDYIRYQYGGYTYHCSYTAYAPAAEERADAGQAGRTSYTVRIEPVYYSYLTWEEAASARVGEILAGFAFDANTTDTEKIRAVYDYLCTTVTYDKVHAKNPHHTGCRTAYAALFLKTATCQGYCTALYRLLREAGISCRIVTGQAEEEALHAWVIAETEDGYRILDPTWDSESKEGYRFFLTGTEEDAGRHRMLARFTEKSFADKYPMAE